MRLTIAVTTIAAVAVAATVSLAQTPAAPPAAPTAARGAEATPAPKAAKERPRIKGGPWTPADARVCLEFPSNLQVIRCAEKYRYMKAPA